MTDALLLRLHQAINRAIARGSVTRRDQEEMRRAYAALAAAIERDHTPKQRLQAALDACQAANVPVAEIAECRMGGWSLMSLMERT